MEDPENFERFKELKVPVRLPKRTYPYFGVVRCPKYNFNFNYEIIQQQHYSSNKDLVTITKIFVKKCLEFMKQRFLNTKVESLRLPRELADL